jgi:hypothetical protein
MAYVTVMTGAQQMRFKNLDRSEKKLIANLSGMEPEL